MHPMLTGRFLLISIISLLAGCANGDGQESPGDKAEWAELQALALSYRGKIPSSPELTVCRGYDIMSVASADSKSRICVILWPKSRESS
jgi:hypothetical protein